MKKDKKPNPCQTAGYTATAQNKAKGSPASVVDRGDDLRKRGNK